MSDKKSRYTERIVDVPVTALILNCRPSFIYDSKVKLAPTWAKISVRSQRGTADQTNLVRGATGCGSVIQLLRVKGKAKGCFEAGTDVLNVACKVERY